MEIVELSENSEIFQDFYRLYEKIFENPDERESSENIRKYLSLKKSDFYENNIYEVLCSIDSGKLTGFLVGDYYAEPEVAVIEFIGVDDRVRNSGIASRLLDDFITRINKLSGTTPKGIFCEVDTSPESRGSGSYSLHFWNHLGFVVVQARYVQPALQDGKNPVSDLILLYRDITREGLSSDTLLSFLRAYFKYAMDIEMPEDTPEYRQLSSRVSRWDLIPLIDPDAYEMYGICDFTESIIDYVVTFPVNSTANPFAHKSDFSPKEATSLMGRMGDALRSIPFVDTAELEVQRGDGVPIAPEAATSDFMLWVKNIRESYFSGPYLQGKYAIRGILTFRDIDYFSCTDDEWNVRENGLRAWIDVDHLGIGSIHFIGQFSGSFHTEELIKLESYSNTLISISGRKHQLSEIAAIIVSAIQKSNGYDTVPTDANQIEFYPILMARCDQEFDEIKAHLYGITNLDNTYRVASPRYIKKFYDEDRSVLNHVYGHYGRKLATVVFNREYETMFEAVTGYPTNHMKARNFEPTGERILLAVLNEYVSEVTSLLHERFYLKRLEFILSLGEIDSELNVKKTLKYLVEVEKLFHTRLEEFRGLSLYSYTELDFALKQARSDMGIREQFEATINGLSTLSRKMELLYRIRNDFNTVLLSYLLTLFTASTLTASIVNFVLPLNTPIVQKLLFIFVPSALAMVILYAIGIRHRE